jgi:hypothetical protein
MNEDEMTKDECEMLEILDRAHKAEAERHGATFTFFCRSEGVCGWRIFSETDRGGFWTGLNPHSRKVHHLWYPCSDAELERWHDLIHRTPNDRNGRTEAANERR